MIFNIIVAIVGVGALVLYFVRKKKMKDQFAEQSDDDDEFASDYENEEEQ